MSTTRKLNNRGTRKPKSSPRLAAQNVYNVRLTTITVVAITVSITTLPVVKNINQTKTYNLLRDVATSTETTHH